MTSRRSLLKSGLAVAALSAVRSAMGQANRPSVVWVGGRGQPQNYIDAFKNRLAQAGWKEGSNLSLALLPHAWNSKDELTRLIEQARAAKPDVVLIDSNDNVIELRRAFPRTPLCVLFMDDPQTLPWAADQVRAGNNLTGTATADVTLGAKRLQLAHEVLPKATRFAIVYSEVWEKQLAAGLESIGEAAKATSVHAQRIGLREDGSVEEMIAALRAAKSEAVIPLGPLSFGGTGADVPQQAKALLDYQNQDKVPFIDNEVESVADGFFIALAEPYVERYKRYADTTAKLLAHADPAAIPVDHAMRIQLWVNTATAKRLGIAVPQTVLSRADRVIG